MVQGLPYKTAMASLLVGSEVVMEVHPSNCARTLECPQQDRLWLVGPRHLQSSTGNDKERKEARGDETSRAQSARLPQLERA